MARNRTMENGRRDATAEPAPDALGGDGPFMREAQRVEICKTRSEIADHIRLKVIYEGLELDEIGIELADVTDDVPLFEEEGLNLDSIDGLEILAGVQREFGLTLSNVDQAFMDEHCATVGRLAAMVEDLSRRGAAGDPSSNGAAGSPSSNGDVGDPPPDGAAGRPSPAGAAAGRAAGPAAES